MNIVVCNQVAGAFGRSADQVVARAGLYLDAVIGTVALGHRAGNIGTDVVTLDDVVVRVDLDAFEVVRDDVAGRRGGAADRVTRTGDNRDTDVAGIRRCRTVRVEADDVALNRMTRDPDALDVNPLVADVRDDVTVVRPKPADRRIQCARIDAVAADPGTDIPGAGRTDPVAGDRDIIGAGFDEETGAVEIDDLEAANDAAVAVRFELKTVLAGGRAAVERDQRFAGVARLCRRVDRDGVGDRGQAAGADDYRLCAAATDVEFDDVVDGSGSIRQVNRFFERTGPGRGGRRHRIRREHLVPAFLQVLAYRDRRLDLAGGVLQRPVTAQQQTSRKVV